jgi:hypothetical protein
MELTAMASLLASRTRNVSGELIVATYTPLCASALRHWQMQFDLKLTHPF